MLSTIWAAPTGRRCIAAIRGKRTIHFWFDDNETAMEKAVELDKEGYNVFFSPSLFDPKAVDKRREEINPKTSRKYTGREQSTVEHIQALWVDIDAGEGKDYENVEAAFQSLQKWITDNHIPTPTHVVCSGYGLHIYWRLSRAVSHREWLPVAKHLKQACRVGGLSIDPARTADSASLMRVPGTHNYKRKSPAPVRVLAQREESVDLQAFRAALPMVGPVGAVDQPATSREWDVTVKHPPGDAHKIADKCQQVGQVRFHKGAVEEPLWRAGLSIVWRCQDGETLIQEWSTGDPRYNPEETRAKAEGTAGPATCQHFLDVNPEGCAGCPFAGTIKSPISLAYAEEAPEAAGDDGIIRVPGYTVNQQGIFMQPLGDDGGPLTKIADFPIWIEESQEIIDPNDPLLKATLLIAWTDVRGKTRRVPITQAKLHDDRQWVAWLADNNLVSFVKAAPMRHFISQMHKARFKEKGARTVYNTLGWYNDHSTFVFGRKAATSDGLIDVSVDIKTPVADFEPSGSLAEWKRAVERLNDTAFYPQAFGVLMGFGAPLLDLVDKNSAVVVFTGRSGYGKSLSACVGLSVFTKPTEEIFESAISSSNGLGMYLSESRHVPVLIDEVTDMPPSKLRDLIFMAANGSAKTTLTQRRERRTMATWRTITMLTSNHSILDMKLSDIEEAHRRRVIEVPVLSCLPEEMAEDIYHTISNNYGVAAGPYLQTLIRHRDQMPALFALAQKKVRSWGYTTTADRFMVWACSAALLGGILAHASGVLPFNPLPIVKAITRRAAYDAGSIMTPEDHARESMLEWLTNESRRICLWHREKIAVEDTHNPVARIDGDWLFVRASELREAWRKERIHFPSIKDWLSRVAPGGTLKYRLSPGTPGVTCFKFNMKALGWEPKALLKDAKEE